MRKRTFNGKSLASRASRKARRPTLNDSDEDSVSETGTRSPSPSNDAVHTVRDRLNADDHSRDDMSLPVQSRLERRRAKWVAFEQQHDFQHKKDVHGIGGGRSVGWAKARGVESSDQTDRTNLIGKERTGTAVDNVFMQQRHEPEHEESDSDVSGTREWELELMRRAGREREAETEAQRSIRADLQPFQRDCLAIAPGVEESFEGRRQQLLDACLRAATALSEKLRTQIDHAQKVERDCKVQIREQTSARAAHDLRVNAERERAEWYEHTWRPYLAAISEAEGRKRTRVQNEMPQHLSDFERVCRLRRKQKYLTRAMWLREAALASWDAPFKAEIVAAFADQHTMVGDEKVVHADRLQSTYRYWALRCALPTGRHRSLTDEAPSMSEWSNSDLENEIAVPYACKEKSRRKKASDVSEEHEDFRQILDEFERWKARLPDDYDAACGDSALVIVGKVFASFDAFSWNPIESSFSKSTTLTSLMHFCEAQEREQGLNAKQRVQLLLGRILSGSSLLGKFCSLMIQINWASKRDVDRLINELELVRPWLHALVASGATSECRETLRMIYDVVCESVESLFEDFARRVRECMDSDSFVPSPLFVHAAFWNVSKAVVLASRVGGYLHLHFLSLSLTAYDSRLSRAVAERGVAQGMLPLLMRDEFGAQEYRLECLHAVIVRGLISLWPQSGAPYWSAVRTTCAAWDRSISGHGHPCETSGALSAPPAVQKLSEILKRVS
ncbi:hypothetical protein FVE85_7092 [Porphyridium purpureum]|uniref:Uncharacterized protein n=1 Tax=Porphyridium purpureum TaxID=35688 RepID=A0A5J4ZA54_PORPP|nr:hypothetical protein FVE85_7092 [Porphyridium purpureum]|eukprot:POR0891..scf295_1